MQNYYLDLPVGDNPPEEINVVVEVPMGSPVKYEYDFEMGMMKVDRVLYAPMPMAVNYGFIPQCWNSEDNDPADAIIVSNQSFVVGTLVPCRVIGHMEMIDSGELDDKIVCVAADDPFYNDVQSIEDLNEHQLKQIKYYFTTYKDIKGKKIEIRAFNNKEKAAEKINRGIVDHKAKFGK